MAHMEFHIQSTVGPWSPWKVFPFLRLVLDIIHRLEAARPGEPEHLGGQEFCKWMDKKSCVYIYIYMYTYDMIYLIYIH